MKFKIWLMERWFPDLYESLMRTAEFRAEREAKERYGRLISSMFRTPQKDSEWFDRFITLEKDYQGLEKELQREFELRFELKTALKALHDQTREYVEINKLGDPYHNLPMQLAHTALMKVGV